MCAAAAANNLKIRRRRGASPQPYPCSMRWTWTRGGRCSPSGQDDVMSTCSIRVAYCKLYSCDVPIFLNSYQIDIILGTLRWTQKCRINSQYMLWSDEKLKTTYVQFIVYYSINSRKWKNHIKIETLIIWKIALVCTKNKLKIFCNILHLVRITLMFCF